MSFGDRKYIAPADARLMLTSTAIICVGAVITGMSLPHTDIEADTYRYGAYGMALTLFMAIGTEALAGPRSLIRVDIVALITLYFLTFAEFLSPNVRILFALYTGHAVDACQLVIAGLALMAVGRHVSFFNNFQASKRQKISLPEVSPRALLITYFLFAFLGYLYVLLVTNFNIINIIQQAMQPRFTQTWQRGAEGDWRSFLTELDLLLYLVAALGGYIFANNRRFTLTSLFGGVGCIAVHALL